MIKNIDDWNIVRTETNGTEPYDVSKGNKPFGISTMVDSNNMLRFFCPHCFKEVDLRLQIIGEKK